MITVEIFPYNEIWKSQFYCEYHFVYINDLPNVFLHTIPFMFANDSKCLKRIKEPANSFTMQLDLHNLSDWSKAFDPSFIYIIGMNTTSPDTYTGVQDYYINGKKFAFHNSIFFF